MYADIKTLTDTTKQYQYSCDNACQSCEVAIGERVYCSIHCALPSICSKNMFHKSNHDNLSVRA